MPELPEVETVRRSLLPIVGARIDAVEVREPRLRRTLAHDFARRLAGRAIHGIERRGKYLLFLLSGNEALLAHLGMSGALLLQPTGTPPQTHDHVVLRLSDDRQVTFNDPRRFGLLRVGRLDELVELSSVGPDPLADAFALGDLIALTRGRKKPVKNLLMDQRALGGSSISDYRDSDGRPGYFQLRFKVYDRAGQPCRRCYTPVRRVVHAGRSSFYCPACQR